MELKERRDWTRFQLFIKTESKAYGDAECIIRGEPHPSYIKRAMEALEKDIVEYDTMLDEESHSASLSA